MARKPRCPECAANGVDHHALVNEFKSNLYSFASYFLPFNETWLTPDFHLPICQWVHKKMDEEGKRFICIMIERGGLKTTLFNVSLVPWMFARNRDYRIIVTMNNADFAKDKCNQQKNIILSDKYRHFFPDVVPNVGEDKRVRWNQDAYDVNRSYFTEDPSVVCRGIGSRFASMHCDVQIWDDLIDGTTGNLENQVRTALQFKGTSEGLWAKRGAGTIICLGTYWAGGFYENLEKDKRFVDSTLILGCYADDRYFRLIRELGYRSKLKEGDPVYSSKEGIEEAKEAMGPYFAHQMENLRCAESGKMFSDFKYFEWKNDDKKTVIIEGAEFPIAPLFKQLVIDPATGSTKSGNDDSAYTVSAWIPSIGAPVILRSYRGRDAPDKLISKIIKDAVLYDVNVVRPEEGGQQAYFTGNLRNEIVKRREAGASIKFSVVPVLPKNQSKAHRIKMLQPFDGNMYLNPDSKSGCRHLQNEMDGIIIESGQILSGNPNMVDSLAYHLEYWMRRPKKKEANPEEIKVEITRNDFDEHRRKVMPRIFCPMREPLSV